jgi:hypothetical protein
MNAIKLFSKIYTKNQVLGCKIIYYRSSTVFPAGPVVPKHQKRPVADQ